MSSRASDYASDESVSFLPWFGYILPPAKVLLFPDIRKCFTLFAQIIEDENAKSIFSEFLNTNRSNYTNIFLLSIFLRMFVRDYSSLLIAHSNYSLDSYNSCSIKIFIKILNYYSCYSINSLQARVHINYPYLSKTLDLR